MGGKAIALLKVRVQAGAREEQILGYSDGILRVAVRVPPVEGAANRALTDLLGRSFHISLSQVRLVHGHKGRNKILELGGLAQQALEDVLQRLLNARCVNKISQHRRTGDSGDDGATKADR